jgi:hypothetical protein
MHVVSAVGWYAWLCRGMVGLQGSGQFTTKLPANFPCFTCTALLLMLVDDVLLLNDISPLCRVPLPALPKGAIQLSVMLNDQPVSFTQTLLVLPAPCAQEMALLWACLLQTRLAAAAQLQPNPPAQQQQVVTQKAAGGSVSRGSLDVGSSVEASGWTSQDSSCSSASMGNSNSAGSNIQGGAAAAGVSNSSASPRVRNVNGNGGGGGGSAVSPNEVQAVWNKQYTPLLTDIAYLLATHQHKAAMPTAGIAVPGSPALAAVAAATGQNTAAIAAAGAAAAAGGVSINSPQFKSMVMQLVQFLAANGMWAVLQLITDSVYGVGASAKALYTAKAAAGAAPAPASASAAATGSTSGSVGSASVASSAAGRDSMSGGRAVAPQAAAAVVGSSSEDPSKSNSSNSNISSVPAASTDAEPAAAAAAAAADPVASAGLQPEQHQQLAAGDAVVAVLTAAAAGQAPGLRAVLMLLLVVLCASIKQKGAKIGSALRSVRQRMMRSAGAAAARAAGLWVARESWLLLHGLLFVVGWVCVQLVQQMFGRREAAAAAVEPSAVDDAVE